LSEEGRSKLKLSGIGKEGKSLEAGAGGPGAGGHAAVNRGERGRRR